MNVLYDDVNWEKVKYVGFDLDGTIYDEFDFIKQVYSQINKQIFKHQNSFEFILSRWIEKGSSYTKIFDEVYIKYEHNYYNSKEKFIMSSLEVFRDFSPTLKLSERNMYILNYFSKNYK